MLQRKRTPSRLSKYRIHAFIVVVVAAGVLTVFWPAYIWSTQLNDDVNKLAAEKVRLAKQNTVLKEEISRLNTPEYIEQLARQDLGLVKPGEVPIAQTVPGKR